MREGVRSQVHHDEFTHVCWGICIRYLWRGLKKTCFFPGRYQLANFSHMALSCLHKIKQTSHIFFLRKQHQNSSAASFPKFPHHLLTTTTKFVFFSFFFILLFSLSLFLCVSQFQVELLFFKCIISRRTEDPRNSNGNGKRERRERERESEKSECGTRQTKLADVESREVASFGRAANDRKPSKNGRTEDENSSQMDGQNAIRKTKWTNSTRKQFQMDEQNMTTKTKWMISIWK